LAGKDTVRDWENSLRVDTTVNVCQLPTVGFKHFVNFNEYRNELSEIISSFKHYHKYIQGQRHWGDGPPKI